MSKQLRMLMDEWRNDEVNIRTKMLELAKHYLDSTDELPWIVEDGAWDCLRENSPYRNCVENNGSEDDETRYLADMWCLVLAQEAHRASREAAEASQFDGMYESDKYVRLICKFLDVSVNGL